MLGLAQNIAAGTLLALGCFFVLVSAIGIVRMPDFYTRMHATGKCDTLGQGLIILGLICHQGATFVSVKLLLIIIFIFIANPTSTHAIAKAAYVVGKVPWKRGEKRR